MTALHVLVTGATGYIGGRLVPRLLERGHRVRVLVRSPLKLTDVPWRDDVEVVQGDLGDPAAVAEAVRGIDAVYYLVHSMRATGDFDADEARAAHAVADASAAAGVRRIVYLGALHPDGPLPATCGRGSRSGASSSTRGFRRPCCRRAWSSAPGRRRSR